MKKIIGHIVLNGLSQWFFFIFPNEDQMMVFPESRISNGVLLDPRRNSLAGIDYLATGILFPPLGGWRGFHSAFSGQNLPG